MANVGVAPAASAPSTYVGAAYADQPPTVTTPIANAGENNRLTTNHILLIVTVSFPVLALCTVFVGVLLYAKCWRKRKASGTKQQQIQAVTDESEPSEEQDIEAGEEDEKAQEQEAAADASTRYDYVELAAASAGPRRYEYGELAAATGDFAEEEKLGRGGFGSVYRGRLTGGVKVAIKKFLSDSSSQGRKQFEAEVKIISSLRHRNLVRLLGWCDSSKGLLLVYELVQQGSLDKHIYNTDKPLTWSERFKVILGLGSALRYLHQEWEQCVVHGDIKPSNIMLDSSYNTKLGDFGLARLVDHDKGWQTTKAMLGTAGYIDPELVNTQRPSTHSDVYSFGIVLLEIVSGRPPVFLEEGKPPFMLLKWVWSLYSRNTILDAVDERLWDVGGDETEERQMERALIVGLWCAHPDVGERPSIAKAMNVLQSDDARLPALWPQVYMASSPAKNFAMGHYRLSGISSSASSGVPSSATTGTTRSLGSSAY